MSVPSRTIGIDLGTTNSVAAFYDCEAVRIIGVGEDGSDGLLPSVLGWKTGGTAGGGGVELVGRPALHNWGFAPHDTVYGVKRLMGRTLDDERVAEARNRYSYGIVGDEDGMASVVIGGRTLTPPEVSERYLKALKAHAVKELGAIDAAVITVPAYFEERQRSATRKAGELAGLRIRRIIDEPTAAAIAYGVEGDRGREIMVVIDLGGGTFDVSVIQLTRRQDNQEPVFHVLQIDGDSWLGGTDLDDALMDHVLDEFGGKHDIDPRSDPECLAVIRPEIEKCRVALSKDEDFHLAVPGAYRGAEKIHTLDMIVTRATLERLIETHVTRVVDIVTRALEGEALGLQAVTTVLLVGGTTRTPLLQRRLADLFGNDRIRREIDPMTAVARGAAILAARIAGIECPNSECGTTRTRLNRRTGKEVTYIERTVTDDTEVKCRACGQDLAEGGTGTDGITIHDLTSSSLGILAVDGRQANAFVCVVPRGTAYPLQEPIRRTFQPNAARTDRILVPVFEAEDDTGKNRHKQGVVECLFPTRIARSTSIEVSFNLDRDRRVTVEVKVLDEQIDFPPKRQTLKYGERPKSGAPVSTKPRWEEDLRRWNEHAQTLNKRYAKFLSDALKRDAIKKHLREAEAAYQEAEKHPVPTRAINEVIAHLQAAVLDSGVASKMYLADLMFELAPEHLKEKIRRTQAEILNQFQRDDQDALEAAGRELESLTAQIPAPEGRGPGEEFKPEDLLNNPQAFDGSAGR